MRSHGRNDRRHGGHKGQDDEHYLGAHGEDIFIDPFFRPKDTAHRTESYRVPSTSNRSSYDVIREASTSRNHRQQEGWRRGDHEDDRHRYSTNEGYHRHSRDDYKEIDRRDPDAWPTHSHDDSQYSQSRAEWSQRYDRGYSSSSAVESSSWNTTNTTPHEYRSVRYENWSSEDIIPDDRRGLAVADDRHIERESADWHRDQRRDKASQPFQSDSGWESRRRSKGWADSVWDNTLHNKNTSNADDRSWEPAPTWKPLGRGDQEQTSRGGQRNYSSNRNHKGGKRGVYTTKQKRDWRSDDGSLNNWQKRESYSIREKINRAPIRRKHMRSSSRSRSRSPAESYYSRRSSRGRSKSRSMSPLPKRQRREASPPAPRSRTPSDRDRVVWNPENYREPSRSPKRQKSLESVNGGRRRSVSSVSSMSSERSRSRSPPGRPRAVHRLPPANASASLSPTLTRAHNNGAQALNAQRNGKNHANGRQSTEVDRRKGFNVGQPSSVDSMPPPSTIPSSYHARSTYSRDKAYAVPDFDEPRGDTSGPPRFTPVKHAGFKPISHTSSTLRKFFPGDDDEADPTASTGRTPPISTQPYLESLSGQLTSPQHTDVQSNLYKRGTSSISPSGPPTLPGTPVRQDPRTRDVSKEPQPIPAENVQTIESPTIQYETRQESADVPPTPSIASRGELYNIISQVGEGTFGKVYKAQNTVTKLHVALKRIRMESEKDGFPVTAMREIKLLQSLRHPNVVRLYEMMVSNGSVYMVFEYMDHDLTGVLSQTQFSFTDAHLKSLCHQMLAGLAYLHHKGVIHRDIKGSNILINNRGELKLADFGLARFYQKRRSTDYTNRVITLWYRPPELLFGATVYGPEVDMWSAGCIMLELFTKKPVFQGNDEIHQLDVVYRIIGTPTAERWAGVMDLPWYELVKPREVIPNRFRELFQKWMSPAALDLAERLLAYDPSQRVNAVQAMSAPYFTQEEPKAVLPTGLATLEGEWHELETKRERAKKRRKPEAPLQ